MNNRYHIQGVHKATYVVASLGIALLLMGFATNIQAQTAAVSPTAAAIDKGKLSIHGNARDNDPDKISNQHQAAYKHTLKSLPGHQVTKPVKSNLKSSKALSAKQKAAAKRKHLAKKQHKAPFHRHR